jgi:hypothetical protein
MIVSVSSDAAANIEAAAAECEEADESIPISASSCSPVGVALGDRDCCGLSAGHSRLSPETEVICRGCSQASIKQRPSLVGLNAFERRATGRGGSAFSCGNGLSFASASSFCTCSSQRMFGYILRS